MKEKVLNIIFNIALEIIICGIGFMLDLWIDSLNILAEGKGVLHIVAQIVSIIAKKVIYSRFKSL